MDIEKKIARAAADWFSGRMLYSLSKTKSDEACKLASKRYVKYIKELGNSQHIGNK